MNWKCCGKDLSWSILKSGLGICLEVLGKSTRNIGHCSRGSVEIRSGNHLNIREKIGACCILFCLCLTKNVV